MDIAHRSPRIFVASLAAAGVLALCTVASAQTPAPPIGIDPNVIRAPADGSAAVPVPVPADAEPAVVEPVSVQDRAADALRLPDLADRLRAGGTQPAEVRVAIDALRESEADADSVADILEDEVDATRGDVPRDNFGAFVQERLQEGLRGRELADSIRAEHRAAGRGPGDARGSAHGGPGGEGSVSGNGHGHPDQAAHGRGHGGHPGNGNGNGNANQPDGAGGSAGDRPTAQGRPDTAPAAGSGSAAGRGRGARGGERGGERGRARGDESGPTSQPTHGSGGRR